MSDGKYQVRKKIMSWKWYVALYIFAVILFGLFPQIDLNVTGFFWNSEKGFYLQNGLLPRLSYNFIPYIMSGMVIFIVLLLVLHLFKAKFTFGISKKEVVFLLLVLMIGPGLANKLSKDYWGRARPIQVQEFGGSAHFTPVTEITNQCNRNCSFFAGHPTVAFYTFAFALLINDRRRRMLAESAAIVFGCVVSYGRIVQGGHFLSDVIFSGLIICGIAMLLHYLVIDRS